jgi:hypothetical protein
MAALERLTIPQVGEISAAAAIRNARFAQRLDGEPSLLQRKEIALKCPMLAGTP